MASNSTTIVWFRRDLRIEDNPALAAAARDGCMFPVFIWCPEEEGQFYPGRASRWWLKQSLAHLEQSLKSLGVELAFIKTKSTLDALLGCVRATGATKVVFNRLYDPVSIVRDHDIKKGLSEIQVAVQCYNGDMIYEPWEVHDNGQIITRFDNYWEKCQNMQTGHTLISPTWRLVPPAGANGNIETCSIEHLGLENGSEKSSNDLLGRAWSPGWANADKALKDFIEHHLSAYSDNRAKLGGSSTSLLSPYLHFGEVSVRKVFQSVQMKQIVWAKDGNTAGLESINLFLRAIGLREYSRYICFNFPFTHERSLLPRLKYFPWNIDQNRFKAWRQGRTGYPLVDAGMRELWATGWMHNRMRIIVSSFCIKFLLLPWQWGMKYFWDTLLDADLESDILGWQYISGSLPDGHELHRFDDPEVQGSKFDPEGDYVRLWLPELARVPTEWIHHPWDAPNTVLRAAGVELGVNYPKPIIEMDLAREHLRDAIFVMKEKAGAEMGENGNGSNEEVFDNAESVVESCLDSRRAILKENPPLPGASSHDQKVPSMNNPFNASPNKKRPRCEERNGDGGNNVRGVVDHNGNNINTGSLPVEEDLCSTADSSSNKKPSTSDGVRFCVPEACSASSSHSKPPAADHDSCDLKLPWQKQEIIDEKSSQDGE